MAAAAAGAVDAAAAAAASNCLVLPDSCLLPWLLLTVRQSHSSLACIDAAQAAVFGTSQLHTLSPTFVEAC